MRKFSFIATLIVFLAFSSGAKAAVITFDDVDTASLGYKILNDYAGATWINFGVVNSSTYNTHYDDATISGTQVAYNVNALGSAEILFNNPVNIDKAYFASAYFEPNNIDISWVYSNGTTGSTAIALDKDFGQWANLGLKEVTSLKFEADNYYFGMDNFTYSPVPEPTSIALGLMSLAGLLGARRRKQTV